MITFYSGTPGSGKSLHVAAEIYRGIRGGVNVIANFEVDEDCLKRRFAGRKEPGTFLYLSNGQLMGKVQAKGISGGKAVVLSPVDALYGFATNFHRRNNRGQILEHQTLLVLDEAQILFNSRTWQDTSRMEWVTFFTQHRKYGYDVIIISQLERLIDRQIRGCFEFEVSHKKVMHYKTMGALMSVLFKGNLFVAVTHWYGVKGKDSVTGSKFFIGRKRLYSLYNSYKIFSREETA